MKKPPAFSVLLLTTIAAATPARSQPLPVGNDFIVNSYTTGSQNAPHVDSVPGGAFVAVFQSRDQDGSGDGIFGRRFSAAAAPSGGQFPINTTTAGAQTIPRIGLAGNGAFVVVWQHYVYGVSDCNDVRFRRFSSTGSPLGNDVLASASDDGCQSAPVVSTESDGDFLLVWEGPGPGDPAGLVGRRFSSAGTALASEFLVNTDTSAGEDNVSIARHPSEAFVAVWRGASTVDVNDILGQRFASNGAKVASEFRVNTYTPSTQRDPSVATASDGGFLVVWHGPGVNSNEVFARRYGSNGTAIAGEFRINSYTTASQSHAAIERMQDGTFIVSWTDGTFCCGGADESQYGVRGQRLAANGSFVAGEFGINAYTTERQRFSEVAAVGGDGFVVVWRSDFQPGQDGDNYGTIGRLFEFEPANAIFSDGFESGTTTAWSLTVP